ncbi:hypothetical protein [Burkholderia multivorans]|uniref:hypothetical protein n=1 Tax=Burkholderia multivorans TaxID=87883 RepID=UPI001FC88265|nr:hypothetical protein [Burkholderia multivorans]MCA8337826.1 hypothetical protein [Burkholderia multivorans]
MTDALFRQEALDATKHKLMGTVALYSPPYRWLTVGIVSAFALAIVAFLTFGTYTKRERVAGQLLPAKGLLSVAPPLAGTVIDMHVREGQTVAAGEALVAVSGEITTQLGATRAMVGQQLKTLANRSCPPDAVERRGAAWSVGAGGRAERPTRADCATEAPAHAPG